MSKFFIFALAVTTTFHISVVNAAVSQQPSSLGGWFHKALRDSSQDIVGAAERGLGKVLPQNKLGDSLNQVLDSGLENTFTSNSQKYPLRHAVPTNTTYPQSFQPGTPDFDSKVTNKTNGLNSTNRPKNKPNSTQLLTQLQSTIAKEDIERQKDIERLAADTAKKDRLVIKLDSLVGKMKGITVNINTRNNGIDSFSNHAAVSQTAIQSRVSPASVASVVTPTVQSRVPSANNMPLQQVTSPQYPVQLGKSNSLPQQFAQTNQLQQPFVQGQSQQGYSSYGGVSYNQQLPRGDYYQDVRLPQQLPSDQGYQEVTQSQQILNAPQVMTAQESKYLGQPIAPYSQLETGNMQQNSMVMQSQLQPVAQQSMQQMQYQQNQQQFLDQEAMQPQMLDEPYSAPTQVSSPMGSARAQLSVVEAEVQELKDELKKAERKIINNEVHNKREEAIIVKNQKGIVNNSNHNKKEEARIVDDEKRIVSDEKLMNINKNRSPIRNTRIRSAKNKRVSTTTPLARRSILSATSAGQRRAHLSTVQPTRSGHAIVKRPTSRGNKYATSVRGGKRQAISKSSVAGKKRSSMVTKKRPSLTKKRSSMVTKKRYLPTKSRYSNRSATNRVKNSPSRRS